MQSNDPKWQLYPAQEFASLRQQWDSLNTESANSILLSSDFIAPLLTHFSSGKELLAVYGDKSAPLAMAIVNKTGLGRWTTFQPSQAPIGCWLQKKSESTENLCLSLAKRLPGLHLVFSITQQDPDCLSRPNEQSSLATLDYIETARITVDSDFDTYWSKRSKNLRQGLKRQRNRLQREETATRLTKITSPEDVEEAITAYGKIESASWKSESGTAINRENTQGKFYLELLESFCRKGQGVIYQYFYNEKIAATDLCITDGTSIIILKTTYDDSISTSSPAMLMRQDSFREIFDNRQYERIEFYGKVMDWHRKWSHEIRRMYHANKYSIIIRLLKKV